MTDTTSTGKPMWKRCGGCKQRVYNDPIDWDGHMRNCPERIRTDLDRFLKKYEKADLDNRIRELENYDPGADIETVDESELDHDTIDDEPVQASTYTDDGYTGTTVDPDISSGHFGGTTARPTL